MTTLTLELTRKEKKAQYQAKYYANNTEKCKAADANYKVNNPEKCKAADAKYYANNLEKVKVKNAKYYANTLEKQRASGLIRNVGRRFKMSVAQARELVPQELIELKSLQLTLFRLIQEKKREN